MALYALSPRHEPSLWSGPRRPTQAEIDAVLVEHFGGRSRVVTLELYSDFWRVKTVAHSDYDGPADDPSELTAVEGN